MHCDQNDTTLGEDSTCIESRQGSPLHDPHDSVSFQEEDTECRPCRAQYQTQYRVKYKAYIQSILESNKDHCALAEIQQLYSIKKNPEWLQEQVTKVKEFIKRLQLDTDIRKAATSKEHSSLSNDVPTSHEHETANFSSPIERTRRNLENSTPSFDTTTATPAHVLSHRKSGQRQRQWRKRVATSSGKKGMDLKKINLTDDPPDEGAPNSFSSYLASSNLLISHAPFHHPTSFAEDTSPDKLSDRDYLHSNLMDTSLSPITQQQGSWNLSHSPLLQDQLEDQSYSSREDNSSVVDDTLQSPDCTIVPRKARFHTHRNVVGPNVVQRHEHREEEEEEEDVEDETPSNVVLQKGRFFHLRPLTVQQQGQRHRRVHPLSNHTTTTSREQLNPRPENFHNYFASYETRIKSRLQLASKWLLSRDATSQQQQQQQQHSNQHSFSQRAALVVNITHSNHAISLVLHMLAQHGTHKSRSSSLSLSTSRLPLSNNSNIPGGTLIIVRTKEDLPLWERALREQSCHSVWNHAAVPAKSRRRVVETAAKCAGTHVVLTTIDCIKSKEVPILVDAKGRAVDVHQNRSGHHQTSQSWFSSRTIGLENKKKSTLRIRDDEDAEEMESNDSESDSLSSASATNIGQPVVKVLSALHGIRWHRLIFVDALEKSYLIQQGGVRSEAAISLHGSSRIILLMQPFDMLENADTPVTKLKESRKQLTTLARTLDLDSKRAAEDVVGRYMLDLQNVTHS